MNNGRLLKRSRTLYVPLLIQTQDGSKILAYMVSLGPAGIGLKITQKINVTDRIVLETLDDNLINLKEFTVKLLWQSVQGGAYYYGGRFENLTENQKSLLAVQLQKLYPRDSRPKKNIISISLKLGIGILMTAIFIVGLRSDLGSSWLKVYIALYGVTFLRIWETFLTSKESKPFDDSDDWTISGVVLYYVLMLILIGAEITFVHAALIGWWTFIAAGIYVCSFLFRLYCVRTLGVNWRIHVQEDVKDGMPNLNVVDAGPYKYLRHPIYLGVIFELLAIPLMLGAPLTAIFVIFVNIPLQVLRSKLEEQSLLKTFGSAYARYMREVGGFIPKKRLSSERVQEKRSHMFILEGQDRRQRR
jgi:protein-S-isoprenylcysteine O-methyltransferase Ste14